MTEEEIVEWEENAIEGLLKEGYSSHSAPLNLPKLVGHLARKNRGGTGAITWSELDSGWFLVGLLLHMLHRLSNLQETKHDFGFFKAMTEDEFKSWASIDRNAVWRHRNVNFVAQEGQFSREYTEISREEFEHHCADYLQTRWLQCPFLDWVLVDSLVYSELSQTLLVATDRAQAKAGTLAIAFADLDQHGGFERQALKILKGQIFSFGLRAGIPLLALWALAAGGFGSGLNAVLGIIAALGLLIPLGWAWGMFKALLRLLKIVKVEDDPDVKFGQLVLEMSQTYDLLKGPVINPMILRDALNATRAKGAVWPSPVFSIVDRLIERDKTAWIPFAGNDKQ